MESQTPDFTQAMKEALDVARKKYPNGEVVSTLFPQVLVQVKNDRGAVDTVPCGDIVVDGSGKATFRPAEPPKRPGAPVSEKDRAALGPPRAIQGPPRTAAPVKK